MSGAPPRPALAFRIGVTGARDLPVSDDLRARVADALRLVRDEIARLAATPEIRAAYHGAVPLLRLISPLAEGADRMVARAALDEGYALVVATPFAQGEYEKDFPAPDSLAEFRDLLSRATARLELDGGRGEVEAASYEAVGRLVVRNCDVLIALWDGGPGKGRGGTADIVRFAANFGPPIWWIRPGTDEPPRWVTDAADLLGGPAPAGADAALKEYLRLTMMPPAHAARSPELLFERLGQLAQKRHSSPQDNYFAEQPLRRPWYWKAHAGLMRLAAGKQQSSWVPPPPPSGPTAMYWHGCYDPADARSSDYGARYRSVYTWVLLLGTLALAAAAVSVAFHELKAPAALVELALLLAIAGLVGANHAQDWHPRWIEYRLLAELCRKQQALAPLGWSLPLGTLDTLAPSTPSDGEAVAAKAPTWVAWLFEAYVRAAPMAEGRYVPDRLDAIRRRVLTELVEDQLHYHADRERHYRRAAHRFALWGEGLFFLVLILICVKLGVLFFVGVNGTAVTLGLLAVIFPALAAGLVGFRSYAELQALAEESHHMIGRLTRAKQHIERLAFDTPLVSQALGARVFEVAIAMLQDIDGWARLFRVKIVEAG